jgi:pyruvate/2-oxoglutarate dehydrogenase complex dihydrolipoamide acyltransferase (E2) component
VVDPHTPQAAVGDPAGEAEEAGEVEEGGGVIVEAAVSEAAAAAQAHEPLPLPPPPSAAAAAAAATPADSYFGAPLRTTPLAGLDPSLALGFMCRDGREWADLVARFKALEGRAAGAPLVCVREGGGQGAWEPVARAGLDRSGADAEDEDEWVLV